jgi:hypothetical protein
MWQAYAKLIDAEACCTQIKQKRDSMGGNWKQRTKEKLIR